MHSKPASHSACRGSCSLPINILVNIPTTAQPGSFSGAPSCSSQELTHFLTDGSCWGPPSPAAERVDNYSCYSFPGLECEALCFGQRGEEGWLYLVPRLQRGQLENQAPSTWLLPAASSQGQGYGGKRLPGSFHPKRAIKPAATARETEKRGTAWDSHIPVKHGLRWKQLLTSDRAPPKSCMQAQKRTQLYSEGVTLRLHPQEQRWTLSGMMRGYFPVFNWSIQRAEPPSEDRSARLD